MPWLARTPAALFGGTPGSHNSHSARTSKGADNDGQENSVPRFTLEQEHAIEQNRKRYRDALNSPALHKFFFALGLESERQRALGELNQYEVTSAKNLLLRFVVASRG